jgi:hypothetical protein
MHHRLFTVEGLNERINKGEFPFKESTTVSHSGPFVKVLGFIDELEDTEIELHIPMSTICFFLNADRVVEHINQSDLDLDNIGSSKKDKEDESVFGLSWFETQREKDLGFVKNMKKMLDRIRDETKEELVWVARVSSHLNFVKRTVMIHPSENDKVGRWMQGGALQELVDMLRYSPFMGGEDVREVQERFEKGE